MMILKSFIPEIFLSFSALLQLLCCARIINNTHNNFPVIEKEAFSQAIFILFCTFFLVLNLKIEGFFSTMMFLNDSSCKQVKLLLLLLCFFTLVIILPAAVGQRVSFFEFFTLFILIVLSLMLLISAADLLSFYLAIEMQALAFYVLASFRRESIFSSESGLKYFVIGAFFSGILLFGISLIYGSLGTINLNNIKSLLVFRLGEDYKTLEYILCFGIALLTVTLLFKVACAPFHFWAPDVYEGAPTAGTVLFSILPKFPLFYFFFKWINTIGGYSSFFGESLFFCGVLSTALGTLFALEQKRIKRLFIYSSIAQIGFLVCGFGLSNAGGFLATYFYLIVYLLTSILVWGFVVLFFTFQTEASLKNAPENTSLFISSLSGLFKFNKLWGVSLVVIFFSISGIPPLLGFLAKIVILFELMLTKNFYIAILLIVLSSVSAFYYIRLIKITFFESKISYNSPERFQAVFFNRTTGYSFFLFSICLSGLIFFFFFPTCLVLFCQSTVLGSFFF